MKDSHRRRRRTTKQRRFKPYNTPVWQTELEMEVHGDLRKLGHSRVTIPGYNTDCYPVIVTCHPGGLFASMTSIGVGFSLICDDFQNKLPTERRLYINRLFKEIYSEILRSTSKLNDPRCFFSRFFFVFVFLK